MIQLHCTGCKEKLSCPDNFAGKLGKCPHCGSKFKVPIPKKSTIDEAESIQDSDILEEDDLERIVDSDILDRGGDDAPEDVVDSDVLAPRPAPSRETVKMPARQATREAARELLSIDAIVDDDEPPALMPPAKEGRTKAVPPPPPATVAAASGLTASGSIHPLSTLFARLWEQKQRGANLELHLEDGEKVAPEGYAPSLSQYTHGVFAVKMLDGTHTMTAIAWDKVSRITLRGVRDLPHGLFS